MMLSPLFNSEHKPKTGKELVVSALAAAYPLTLVKLLNHVRKQGATVTFQGIRKAVLQLVEEKTVEKKGKQYSLNKKWILQLRQFAEQLHQNYAQSTRISNVDSLGEAVKIYTFDNLVDLDWFLDQLIKTWFEESPEHIYVQHAGHAYFVIANLEEEHKTIEALQKNKVTFYTSVGGKSLLDSLAGKYFTNQGFKHCLGVGSTTQYFGAYIDRLFQYELPPKLTKQLEHFYTRTNALEDLDISALINILRQECKIKVMILHNSLLAEQLRERVLSEFK